MTLPVLIVGAGPVGMTLASELTRYGVAVRIVDKAAARTDKSKALVLWSRTLELLNRSIDGGAAPGQARSRGGELEPGGAAVGGPAQEAGRSIRQGG